MSEAPEVARVRPWHDRLERAARSWGVRAGVFALLALCASLPALAQGGGMNRFHDAQFLSAYERHAVLAVLRFGELPLWDPYACGGMYGLAAPQTRYLSPLFLLSLLLGVDRAQGLSVFVLLVAGMEGAYRYARSYGARAFGALLAAPLLPLSGFFGLSLRFGWLQFLSFALLPWLMWCTRGVLRGERRAGVLLGCVVALTIGIGGTYTLPMALIPCTWEALGLLLPRGSTLRAHGVRRALSGARARGRALLRGLVWALPWLLGMTAVRLWPMLESASATLRVMGGRPENDLAELARSLLVMAEPGDSDSGHFYLGPPFLLLAAFGLFGRRRGPLVYTALSLALGLGQFADWAPFTLLRALPLYDTLRYPERYWLISALGLSVYAALGASALCALLRRRVGARAALGGQLGCAALALVGAGMLLHNLRVQASDVTLEPLPREQRGEFRQSRGNRWLMSHFAALDLGGLACGEAYPVPMSQRLRGDLAREEYLVDPARGTPATEARAMRERWSPNALTVQVDSPRPVRLAVNQNYHPGWRADVGEVVSWDGLLAVDLPAGAQRVTLRFRPRSALLGGLVSALAWVLGLAWLWRPARGGVLRAWAPLAVALLGRLVWAEEPSVRPPPLSAALEPIVRERLPADAAPLGVEFEEGLVLEGVRLPSTLTAAEARALPVTLYLRRTGPLSPELGLFVHVTGPAKKRATADHASLSSVVYLARMPEGALIEDSFVVPLPAAPPGAWQVRVGLWGAYGDEKRVPILSAGRASVRDQAALVGTVQVGEEAPP